MQILHKGAQGRPVSYWQAGHFCANYLRKIDLVYDGADSITLNWFNEVFYKLRYYSIYYLKSHYSDPYCNSYFHENLEIFVVFVVAKLWERKITPPPSVSRSVLSVRSTLLIFWIFFDKM